MISGQMLAQQSADFCGTLPSSDLRAEEIEQRIIRAYIRLVFEAEKTIGFRTVTVTRLGPLEVRLTEMLENNSDPSMPSLWLEVSSLQHPSPIDGYGMSDFDDSEITAAAEFIIEAARSAESQDFSLRFSRKSE
ncbi:hypothetical protein AA309_29135 [Microvirga vignae]|uniref:Uncharacterized protein n=1 Tax=Microvirga vignae TaxID=1225564 RepID=A0A0H1R3Z0_9HYPH|nr:hypothetical protein [Microvirga vignae]KLK89818.1 hypothetical protein AA309_29135 [Microvirga vignae]